MGTGAQAQRHTQTQIHTTRAWLTTALGCLITYLKNNMLSTLQSMDVAKSDKNESCINPWSRVFFWILYFVVDIFQVSRKGKK